MKRSKRKPEQAGDGAPSISDARLAAMNLLARREHSARELQRKLSDRGFPAELIDAALAELRSENLLNDARFAESYVSARRERGYGPLRIRADLRERGVSDEIIDIELDERDGDWKTRAEAVRVKRFGASRPVEWKERARQARFLQYRGFSSDHVRDLLSGDGEF